MQWARPCPCCVVTQEHVMPSPSHLSNLIPLNYEVQELHLSPAPSPGAPSCSNVLSATRWSGHNVPQQRRQGITRRTAPQLQGHRAACRAYLGTGNLLG